MAPKSDHPFSFDVTCSIGTVVEDPNAELSMTDQAFLLIARSDNTGTFRFPSPNGGVDFLVTVETELQDKKSIHHAA